MVEKFFLKDKKFILEGELYVSKWNQYSNMLSIDAECGIGCYSFMSLSASHVQDIFGKSMETVKNDYDKHKDGRERRNIKFSFNFYSMVNLDNSDRISYLRSNMKEHDTSFYVLKEETSIPNHESMFLKSRTDHFVVFEKGNPQIAL